MNEWALYSRFTPRSCPIACLHSDNSGQTPLHRSLIVAYPTPRPLEPGESSFLDSLAMASSGPSKAPPEHDIWSAERYGTSVAPFVPKFTTRIVEWLDPQPSGESLFRPRKVPSLQHCPAHSPRPPPDAHTQTRSWTSAAATARSPPPSPRASAASSASTPRPT